MHDTRQRLADEAACRKVLTGALDWLDIDALTSLFWPDAAVDDGFFTGTAADFIPIGRALRARNRHQPKVVLHAARDEQLEFQGLHRVDRAPISREISHAEIFATIDQGKQLVLDAIT